MGIIISTLISLIAYECGNLPFENAFFYISLAVGLFETFLSLQKKCKKYLKRIRRRKRFQNTYDTNSKPDKTDSPSVKNL